MTERAEKQVSKYSGVYVGAKTAVGFSFLDYQFDDPPVPPEGLVRS
jgi:hypothetical protein